jgi:hypothetical protein
VRVRPHMCGDLTLVFRLCCVGWGFTQPLTKMSTGYRKIIMFLGSKVRWVRRADNLTAMCEPIV